MALSVRSPAVEYLARRLAEQTGGTMTETIERALEGLRQSLEGDVDSKKEQLTTIVSRCAALPDLDSRSIEEILGYGDSGANDL